MTTDEVKEFITNLILQSLDGARGVENNKLDFKREWYQSIIKDEGQYKLLIDLTALINSYGGGDAFLIIGYDEKSKEFVNSPFNTTGLRDTSDLVGIIKRKIDRPFNIQFIELPFEGDKNRVLSIIHIPPSPDKPHVIRNLKIDNVEYLNEIFIRKGDTNERASKSDLDLMYAEKGNIIIDRKAIVGLRLPDCNFAHEKYWNGQRITTNENIFFHCEISVENLGFRPLAINRIDLEVSLIGDSVEAANLYLRHKLQAGSFRGDKNLTLPNSIEIFNITLGQQLANFDNEASKQLCELLNEFKMNPDRVVFKRMTFLLSNGEQFLPDFRIVES